MSTQNNNSQSSADNSQGSVLGSILGKNVNKIQNFTVASGFSWREPPLSWIGNIYPTERTYHPLVVNNNYEIATNLFSLEGAEDTDGKPLDDNKKKLYRDKIRTLVEDSSYLQELYISRVCFTFIIIVFIVLLVLKEYGYAIGLAGATFFVVLYYYIYGYNAARIEGQTKWTEFANMLNSELRSGTTPNEILNKLKQSDNILR